MFNAKSQKIFSLLAGIFFAILPLFTLMYVVALMLRYDFISFRDILSFDYILCSSCFIGLSVITFMRKKALPFVIVSGIYVSVRLYYICMYFSIFDIISFLSYSTLFFIALINCIPALHKKTNIQKYICFIPSALIVLSLLMEIFSGYYYYIDFLGVVHLLLMLTESATLLFAGFWLVDVRKPQAATENLTFVPYSAAPAVPVHDTIGGADKLVEYKKLLDDGIITQEEFEEKKKQVLNLYF